MFLEVERASACNGGFSLRFNTGAAGDDAGAQVFSDRIMGELISAYQFGK
jgi:hypothetical protein